MADQRSDLKGTQREFHRGPKEMHKVTDFEGNCIPPYVTPTADIDLSEIWKNPSIEAIDDIHWEQSKTNSRSTV
jgi:hypothetical protein